MVFCRKIFGRVVKIAISVARESFLMKTTSDKKNCNSILFGLWETLSYFWRQSYVSLFKISLYMFRRTFWGEIGFLESFFFSAFPEFEQKVFRVLTRKFWQGCHNCILHVHRNILRNFFIISKNSWFFRRFRNLRCKSVDFYRENIAGFIKIAFYVAEESCLMKKNLLKKL